MAIPLPRRFIVVGASIFLVLTFLWATSDTSYASHVKSKLPSSWHSSPSPLTTEKVEPIVLDPSCSTLPGVEDVLLVMKTGSSVIDKRLPVHFKTTFRCTPDFLVFSDLAQEFHGLQVHDSLDELYKYVDMSNPDLKYYEYLKKTSSRSHSAPKPSNGGGWMGKWTSSSPASEVKEEEGEKLEGKESDAAWEMDKYKNIPILRKSYALYPEKKWFLFVDADTSIMWSNILTWLALLDSSKPFYTGSQNWIGDVEFAHGGSGYIVSQAAARILADEEEEMARKHIAFAEHECCGDMVLAHAFHDNNIALNGSWPNIQGSKPDTLDYDDVKWCHAAMTFHHTSPAQTEELWRLDREMEGVQNITYATVFNHLIKPRLHPTIEAWDNGSEDHLYPPNRPQEDFEADPENSWKPRTSFEEKAVESFEGCRDACKEFDDCFQYVWRPNVTSNGQPKGEFNGQCGLRMAITLGEAKEVDEEREAVVSGFDLERIDLWARKHQCREAVFLTEWDDSGNLEPPRDD